MSSLTTSMKTTLKKITIDRNALKNGHKDVTEGPLLGSGGFGDVYKVCVFVVSLFCYFLVLCCVY
jgi:hypothetical protein